MFKLICPRCSSTADKNCSQCGSEYHQLCEWRACSNFICENCEPNCINCTRYYCSHCRRDGYCFGCYENRYGISFSKNI